MRIGNGGTAFFVFRCVILYSGRALDCWSTSRTIDPEPGAGFITKFIALAQVVPGAVKR